MSYLYHREVVERSRCKAASKKQSLQDGFAACSGHKGVGLEKAIFSCCFPKLFTVWSSYFNMEKRARRSGWTTDAKWRGMTPHGIHGLLVISIRWIKIWIYMINVSVSTTPVSRCSMWYMCIYIYVFIIHVYMLLYFPNMIYIISFASNCYLDPMAVGVSVVVWLTKVFSAATAYWCLWDSSTKGGAYRGFFYRGDGIINRLPLDPSMMDKWPVDLSKSLDLFR